MHKSRHPGVLGMHVAMKLPLKTSRRPCGIALGEPPSARPVLRLLRSPGRKGWSWEMGWISGFLQPLKTVEMEEHLSWFGGGLQVTVLVAVPVVQEGRCELRKRMPGRTRKHWCSLLEPGQGHCTPEGIFV